MLEGKEENKTKGNANSLRRTGVKSLLFFAPHHSHRPKFTTKTCKLPLVVVAQMGREFEVRALTLPSHQIWSIRCIYSLLRIFFYFKIKWVCIQPQLLLFISGCLFKDDVVLSDLDLLTLSSHRNRKGNLLHFYRNLSSCYICQRVKFSYL